MRKLALFPLLGWVTLAHGQIAGSPATITLRPNDGYVQFSLSTYTELT